MTKAGTYLHTEPTPKPFSEEEKVRILLQEYASLHSDILTRTNNTFQLTAVSGAVAVWLLGRESADVWFWFALVISVFILSYSYLVINRDINKAAKRLRELEKDINRRAGEELMEWQTRWGGAVTGYWGRAKPLPPKLLLPNSTQPSRTTGTSPAEGLHK